MGDPITEQTAQRLIEIQLRLIEATEQNTAALLGRVVPQQAKRQVDPAYLPGGVEWMKIAPEEEQREYRKRLMKERRSKQCQSKKQ